jgi:hypothetical protein
VTSTQDLISQTIQCYRPQGGRQKIRQPKRWINQSKQKWDSSMQTRPNLVDDADVAAAAADDDHNSDDDDDGTTEC